MLLVVGEFVNTMTIKNIVACSGHRHVTAKK